MKASAGKIATSKSRWGTLTRPDVSDLSNLSFPRKVLFVFTLLVGICFWSNLALDINPWGSRLGYPLMAVYCLILLQGGRAEWKAYEWKFSGIVKWTVVTIFFSIIPAYVDWDQSVMLSLSASIKCAWPLLVYFVLRRWNVGTAHIMGYVIALSAVWVILEIGQQFTYPDYWFAGRPGEGYDVAQRMGLYRFYIWGVDFVMMAFAYCMGMKARRENKFSISLSWLGMLFLIGLLCYCSRKHIYVTLLTVGIVLLSGNSRFSWLTRTVLALSVFAIIYDYYSDFVEMNEMAVEKQGEGGDFIRWLALDYYLFHFSDSPLYFWLGSGFPSTSKLGIANTYAMDVLRFYRADIGIFGYYSIFGIIGTLPFVLYIWKFLRNWSYIDLWFKLFFIMKLVLIVFDFWGNWNVGMLAYAIFLYMLELNIQKNKGQRVKT